MLIVIQSRIWFADHRSAAYPSYRSNAHQLLLPPLLSIPHTATCVGRTGRADRPKDGTWKSIQLQSERCYCRWPLPFLPINYCLLLLIFILLKREIPGRKIRLKCIYVCEKCTHTIDERCNSQRSRNLSKLYSSARMHCESMEWRTMHFTERVRIQLNRFWKLNSRLVGVVPLLSFSVCFTQSSPSHRVPQRWFPICESHCTLVVSRKRNLQIHFAVVSLVVVVVFFEHNFFTCCWR